MEKNRDKIKSLNESREKKQSQESQKASSSIFSNIIPRDKPENFATSKMLTREQINPNILTTCSNLKRV